MTSNTDGEYFDQYAQASVFQPVQMKALSPFKPNPRCSAAFRPLPASKDASRPLISYDHASKRVGFQLVIRGGCNDKENAPPTRSDQKRRLQSKIARGIEQKTKPPASEREAQSQDRSRATQVFCLSQFNSILLGRRPNLESKKRSRGSVFQIKSSKPTLCAVTVKGLTIQVKIDN